MSNVLPEERKGQLWRLAVARAIIAGSTLALAIALLALLALFPSYGALHAGEGDVPKFALVPGQNSGDRTTIAQTQALLRSVSPIVSATTTPSGAIRAALALRPSGVSVDHATYTSGTPSSLMLVGSAKSRDGISAYRAALASDGRFTNVSVPVNDLIGTQDGKFSMTLSGNF